MEFQSQSGSGSSQTTPTLPPELAGILGGTNPYGPNPYGASTIPQMLRESLSILPSPGQYIQNMPTQQIAPLTSGQTSDIQSLQNLSTNPFALNPEEASAAQTYGMLEMGPNAAVPYGENVFASSTAPTVESQMALAGLGNSGALGENLALAGEQMALPLAEQGISEMGTGAAGMAGLGGTSYQQGMSNLSSALQAAGIPQQEAQAILNAQYQQQMNQTQAGLGFEQQLTSFLPALIGQQSTQDTSGSSLGFNLLGNL